MTEKEKFLGWFNKEKEEGLFDVKFFPGNTADASLESAYRELNVVAAALKNNEFEVVAEAIPA